MAKAPHIEEGDTVKLRSQRNVRMTVLEVYDNGMAKVCWFASGPVLIERVLPIKSLIKVEEGR
jgi:uncharacterized protein YodC (DUF2158 family)